MNGEKKGDSGNAINVEQSGKNIAVSHMPVLGSETQTNACRKRACQIQKCLKDTGYDMKACSWEIEALRKCCEQDFARESLHCAFAERRHGKDRDVDEKQ